MPPFYLTENESRVPDLDDLVGLIRYLRMNNRFVEIGWPALSSTLAVAWRAPSLTRDIVDYHWVMTEARSTGDAYYVGPNGYVFDKDVNQL